MIKESTAIKERSVIFVLLSDLHFGLKPLSEGETCYGEIDAITASQDPYFNQIIRALCKAHDFTLLDQLPQCIRGLAYDEGVASYQFRGGSRHYEHYKFDLFIFLGDLVTYPTQSAFSLVSEFIGGRRALRIPFSKELDEVHGLKLLDSEYLMIPGNHDKLLEPDLAKYYRNLCYPLRYPFQPNASGSFMESRVFQGQEFLFVSIDASIYLKENQSPMLELSHFAQGNLSSELHEELRRKFISLRQNNRVDKAEIKNWTNTFKILLVHYAVDEKKVLGRFPHPKHYLPPLNCKLLKEFVDCSGGDIDLVLHGHLHKPKLYSQNRIPVVSVPTCTQMGGNQGFYVLRVFQDKKVMLQHYRWNKTGFSRDRNPVLSGMWADHAWLPLN